MLVLRIPDGWNLVRFEGEGGLTVLGLSMYPSLLAKYTESYVAIGNRPSKYYLSTNGKPTLRYVLAHEIGHARWYNRGHEHIPGTPSAAVHEIVAYLYEAHTILKDKNVHAMRAFCRELLLFCTSGSWELYYPADLFISSNIWKRCVALADIGE